MSGMLILINLSLAVTGVTIALIGLAVSAMIPKAIEVRKRFFVVFFAVVLLYVLSDLIGQLVSFTSGVVAARTLLFIESLSSSVLLPMLTYYFTTAVDGLAQKRVIIAVTDALWSAYALLLIINEFTGAIYYYTPDNVYHRGDLYPALLVPLVLLIGFNLFCLLRMRRRLTGKQFAAFFIYLAVPLVCIILQMFFYGLYFTILGTALAALIMLFFLVLDQVEFTIAQEKENERNHAKILVYQMRPHFIYNAMTSIYYLCGQDPVRAQQVTLDFTTYLRKNFTALTKDDTIPFTEELEHTRAYLAVEQVRFEGQLFVEFNTKFTSFRLPPLTLQPIVENAVKHGVDPELEPLYISITTRSDDKKIVITVEDSGPGFSPTDDDEPHVALRNIKDRLDLLLSGRLEIETAPEGGTRVTITLPQRAR